MRLGPGVRDVLRASCASVPVAQESLSFIGDHVPSFVAQAGFWVLGWPCLSQEGQEVQGTGRWAQPAPPAPAPAPDLPTREARPPSAHNAPSHVQTGGLDAHAPFCAGGSGVGEWPQRVILGPQQEEISPREEWGGGRRKDTSLKGGGHWPARPAKPVLIVMTGHLRTEMPVKPNPADAHTGLCPELLS